VEIETDPLPTMQMQTHRHYILRCPGCQERIVLPHQGHLGTYGHQQYLPKGKRPITYLCQSCGLVSELSVEASSPEDVRVPIHSLRSDKSWCLDLWLFEFSCGHGNSQTKHTIYSAGLKDGRQSDIIGNILGPTGFCHHADASLISAMSLRFEE